MGTFIRLFNLNDADKPPEGSQSQTVPDAGMCPPELGRTLAARAVGSDNTREAEMAQPELLEAATEDTRRDVREESAEPGNGRAHGGIGLVDAESAGDQGDEGEQGEETTAGEEEAPVVSGDDLIDLSHFEWLFQRYQTPIINFVYRLVGNREQACDLSQDVFVKAYKALAGGTKIHSGALSAWLYRIAANTATDALRRKRLIAWLPLSLFNEDRGVGAGVGNLSGESGGGGAEEGFSGAASLYDGGSYNGGRFEQRVADREIVDKVLSKLPVKYATCLLLYEHEGFSCNEIADVLKISPSAVKMRLMRARE